MEKHKKGQGNMYMISDREQMTQGPRGCESGCECQKRRMSGASSGLGHFLLNEWVTEFGWSGSEGADARRRW